MTQQPIEKPTPYSRLLINEPPLQVLPSLAVRLGLNESIFVQQLHWMLTLPKLGKEIGGRKWIYKTIEEWHEDFPFWSINTIRRTIQNLVNGGIVLEGNYNEKLSRTKWYAIDYAALDASTIKKPKKKRDDYPNFGDTMNAARTSKVETYHDPKLGNSNVLTLDVDLTEISSETLSQIPPASVATAPLPVSDPIGIDEPLSKKQQELIDLAKAENRLTDNQPIEPPLLNPGTPTQEPELRKMLTAAMETPPPIALTPAPPRAPSEPSGRKGRKVKTRTERPRNPVFDAIALGSFGLTKVAGKVGGRIGSIVKEVELCTPDDCLPTLAEDLTGMYPWHRKTYPNLSAPTQGITICKYLAEYRASKQKSAQAANVTYHIVEPDNYVAPSEVN